MSTVVLAAIAGLLPVAAATAAPATAYALPIWPTTPTASFPTPYPAPPEVALSADGDAALIGDNDAAYLYTNSRSGWEAAPSATLTGYGLALSADGGTALVMASDSGTSSGSSLGVYEDSGGQWARAATFTSPNPDYVLSTVAALAANGQTVLVRAYNLNANAVAVVYIYDEVAGQWSSTPTGTLTAPDAVPDAFGDALTLSANGQVAILTNGGEAYVYYRDGQNWPSGPSATLVQSNPSAGRSDYSLSISADGRTALIGARGYEGGPSGSAQVYTTGANGWTGSAAPDFTWTGPGPNFAESVTLSADGRTVVATDPDYDGFAGAAYLYQKAGGSWSMAPAAAFSGLPSPINSGWGLGFGLALSANGQTLLIGGELTSDLYTKGALTVDVSGSQTSVSSGPTFWYKATPTPGIEVTGSVSCSTLDSGLALATVANGSYTLDGSSCGGLSVTGPDASAYTLSYRGALGGYFVTTGSPPAGSTGPKPQTARMFNIPQTPWPTGTSLELVGDGGGSFNPVVLSLDPDSGPGVCTLSATEDGATIDLTEPGACVIDGIQAGNPEYAPAPQVQQKIQVVAGEHQRISFPPLTAMTLAQSPFTMQSAGASSDQSVWYSTTTPQVCMVGGPGLEEAEITLVQAGICTIVANQPGGVFFNADNDESSNYQAARPVARSFSVTKAAQRITFGPLANKALSRSPVTVTAKASSGLMVLFTTGTPAVCTVSANNDRAEINLLNAGMCSVIATQRGNPIYNAATPVVRSFRVG